MLHEPTTLDELMDWEAHIASMERIAHAISANPRIAVAYLDRFGQSLSRPCHAPRQDAQPAPIATNRQEESIENW